MRIKVMKSNFNQMIVLNTVSLRTECMWLLIQNNNHNAALKHVFSLKCLCKT